MKIYQTKILILVATATSITIGFVFFVFILVSFGFLSGLLSDYNGGTSVSENTIGSVAVPVVGEEPELIEGIDLISEKEATQEPEPIPEKIIAKVTAYTLSADETDGTPCIGASGRDLCLLQAQGASTCACPTRYDFGTRFEIAGNIFTCEDRMAKRLQNMNFFDIVMTNKQRAYEWGSRMIQITKL